MTFMTYKKVFHPQHGQKLIRTPTFLHFSDKQCQFTQNFAKQPYIFLFPKFLELFFTPKNTSPKVKNSKLGKRSISLGHPVHTNIMNRLKANCVELLKYFAKNGTN